MAEEKDQPPVSQDPPATSQASSATDAPAAPSSTVADSVSASLDAATATATAVADDLAASTNSIDELLKQASFEDPSTVAATEPATENFELPNFQQVVRDVQMSSIDLLRDVDLNVKIELGRTRMMVEDVLKLSEGSVVELEKLAGDPVDVFVNDRLVARGEVLVLNDNFCVRINEIVAGAKEEDV